MLLLLFGTGYDVYAAKCDMYRRKIRNYTCNMYYYDRTWRLVGNPVGTRPLCAVNSENNLSGKVHCFGAFVRAIKNMLPHEKMCGSFVKEVIK